MDRKIPLFQIFIIFIAFFNSYCFQSNASISLIEKLAGLGVSKNEIS